MDAGRVSRVQAEVDAERLYRVRSRADCRPRKGRAARRRGDGLRPLPAGAAAGWAADHPAQPEPRPRGIGGADSRRRAAAGRYAGAAAADHGRVDRSALLRCDAGPAGNFPPPRPPPGRTGVFPTSFPTAGSVSAGTTLSDWAAE